MSAQRLPYALCRRDAARRTRRTPDARDADGRGWRMRGALTWALTPDHFPKSLPVHSTVLSLWNRIAYYPEPRADDNVDISVESRWVRVRERDGRIRASDPEMREAVLRTRSEEPDGRLKRHALDTHATRHNYTGHGVHKMRRRNYEYDEIMDAVRASKRLYVRYIL
jgi:hypothetical protein